MARRCASTVFLAAWACIAAGALGEEAVVEDAPDAYKFVRADGLRAYIDFDDAYEDSAR
jgi:hypothetical protein